MCKCMAATAAALTPHPHPQFSQQFPCDTQCHPLITICVTIKLHCVPRQWCEELKLVYLNALFQWILVSANLAPTSCRTQLPLNGRFNCAQCALLIRRMAPPAIGVLLGFCLSPALFAIWSWSPVQQSTSPCHQPGSLLLCRCCL